MEDQNENRRSLSAVDDGYVPFPVYLKCSPTDTIVIHSSFKHLQSVNTLISETVNIPKADMFVSFYGRVLSENVLPMIQPYDSLSILIKGKGGMLDGQVEISKESSEKDLQKWLKHTINLSETDLIKFSAFDFLDGRTLLAYDKVEDLASDLKIPVGLSRKIFFMRQPNAELTRLLQSEMARWSVLQVQDFVRSSISTGSPVVGEICRGIDEAYIDGIVLVTYNDPKELQTDLHMEDKVGVIFKRILTKRDDILDEYETSAQCKEYATVEAKKEPTNIALLPPHELTCLTLPGPDEKKQEEWRHKDCSVKKNKISKLDGTWSTYLRDVFSLVPFEISTGSSHKIRNCKLNIIHSDWKNRNDLEKKVLFLVLCTENEYLDEKSNVSLWDRIRKNLHKWHEHFEHSDKILFTVSQQKEDTLIFKNKSIILSKINVKMRFLLEKTLAELVLLDNVFLLISKNVEKDGTDFYRTLVENPRKKNPAIFDFTFSKGHKYWIFNPDDYSYGFVLETISNNSCGSFPENDPVDDNKGSIGNEAQDASSIGDAQIHDKKEENVQAHEIKEENVQAHEIKEENVQAYEKKEENDLIATDYTENSNALSTIHPKIQDQRQRRFKDNEADIQYIEGRRILTAEHDGSVSFRCFEFKFVPLPLIKKGSEQVSVFLNKETLRFASGCLNARKNGTIMFGVADSQGNQQYKHGEVVGVDIEDIPGDFRAHFTDSLRAAIKICFEDHCCKAAANCIGNPVFVKVISKKLSNSKCIVEIDIEPSSIYCKKDFFKINRRKICASKDVEKDYTLYVRENTGTYKKSKADEMIFIKAELGDIIAKRMEDEKQMFFSRAPFPIEYPMDKLRKVLCKGTNKLDKSIWPILVMNKPTVEQKSDEEWIRWLKFIKLVDFHAVFDFDAESNMDGLCSIYRNEENSILQDEEIFLEYSGNKLDLRTKLGIPHDMKTVWIFCNGRLDIKPEKPPKSDEQWSNLYSAGVRDAVIFYSQKEIIPRGRALVIILLFSDSFDGLKETFREIDVRFGWEQTVIIATENILDRFISECRDKEESIKKCAISGESVTWEHVYSTFSEITGYEDQGNIFLTTSTGAFVTADEKFVETLTEFHILSARQCENKAFTSFEEEDKFSSEKEKQFYRGEKVDWFNFYFKTHVLERHCFDRLKTAVSNILQYTGGSSDRETSIVSTVIIAHEPGAGGTTLSRHILWAFHKTHRCAVIKKITDRTAKNVLSFWQHKETSNAKPLLILIDELPQSDLTFDDLIRQIYVEYRYNPINDGLICCFLLCQREHDITETITDEDIPITNTNLVIEHLKQKLTTEEIKWMDEKFNKLEKKDMEYRPEYLLSFMILREGFSQQYIKNTIKDFLSRIKFASDEFELLEYASLLSTYAPTSRGGPNVFIPIECCDELMRNKVRKSVFWEKNISSELKMFLIIEQKESASGMQIRMAHPALAEAVLSQILQNKNENLSSLAERFLDCAILQSKSYGREMVLDCTREMLTRRLKEEYNDDKTTSFSPLIEDIRKRESWENAKKVLVKGFDIIKDHYICQTLARLCSTEKDFENGIFWARKAVEMSIGSKITSGFCHQTFGIVLDEKFNEKTEKLSNVLPSIATEYIAISLDAYDHFMEAYRLRIGTTDHILYPVTGILNTVLGCLNFIRNKVKLPSSVDLKRLVTDETYFPDELKEWEPFKSKFLQFASSGENAFTIIERCLCFNTTFYAHDKVSSSRTFSREHRLNRRIQYRYPRLFNDYRSFFGIDDSEPPSSVIQEVTNDWHRRCVLSLGGNSYMNIFNILKEVKSRKKQFNTKDAIAKCIEIKEHLLKISDRTSKDLTNLVSVNIVLGLLGGEKRESTETILAYCKEIIKFKRENEDIAYFFICILLWPSSHMDIDYDDNLFYESLRYLHRKKEFRQNRQRDLKYAFLKEEKNVTQPTSQFFLTNGRGFKSLCDRLSLFYRQEAELRIDQPTWENFGMKYNLKRLKGYLKFNESKLCIRLHNEKSSSSQFIDIRKIRTGKREFVSEEEVYFFLGFSIAGPIAYNVKPVRYEDLSEHVYNTAQIEDKVEQYLEESVETLQGKLNYIAELKSKMKNGRIIKQRDRELMKNEDDIRTALEVQQPFTAEQLY